MVCGLCNEHFYLLQMSNILHAVWFSVHTICSFARLLDRLRALTATSIVRLSRHIQWHNTNYDEEEENVPEVDRFVLNAISFDMVHFLELPFFSRSRNTLFFVQSASWVRIARRNSMEIWQHFSYYVCKIVSTIFFSSSIWPNAFSTNIIKHIAFILFSRRNSWKYQKDCVFATHDKTRHKYAQHFPVYRFFSC